MINLELLNAHAHDAKHVFSFETLGEFRVLSDPLKSLIIKNYNFLDCDWFKKLLFLTNSLAKLLSDSLLLDSLLSDSLLSDSSISQSYSKL